MPKFSIIIPTFNAEHVIEKCISSVMDQNFNDIEILIQDGLSTDNTLEKISVIQSLHKHVSIKVSSGKDKGVYDAMNMGIKRATGDWIYFLGSDDYLLNNDVLQQISKALDNTSSDYNIVYGNVNSDLLGDHYDGEFDAEKLCKKNICHQAIFYRRQLFNIFGLYDLKYPFLADYVFNLKVLFNKKVKAKYVDITIAYFSKGGLSNENKDVAFEVEKFSIIKSYGYKVLPLRILKYHCASNKEFFKLLARRILVK